MYIKYITDIQVSLSFFCPSVEGATPHLISHANNPTLQMLARI